jgi:GT2 family glycosyltransferase
VLDAHERAGDEPLQTIVTDNGSRDGSVEVVEAIRDRAGRIGVDLTLIRNDHNVGACTARNQALQVAHGERIAFLDNDVLVRTTRWLSGLGEVLGATPDCGIVGPKLLYPFEPFDIQCAGVGISPSGRVQYLGRGEPREAPAHGERREVQCLISACWLMKREIYDRLGGLDEVFNPAQYEDFDLCYRAREAGYTAVYEPTVEMYHFENVTTSGSVDVNYKYVTIRNGLKFKQRWAHRFSREEGPADEETKWATLEMRPIEVTGIPPMA